MDYGGGEVGEALFLVVGEGAEGEVLRDEVVDVLPKGGGEGAEGGDAGAVAEDGGFVGLKEGFEEGEFVGLLLRLLGWGSGWTARAARDAELVVSVLVFIV